MHFIKNNNITQYNLGRVLLFHTLTEQSWILIFVSAFNLLQYFFLIEECKEKLASYRNDI